MQCFSFSSIQNKKTTISTNLCSKPYILDHEYGYAQWRSQDCVTICKRPLRFVVHNNICKWWSSLLRYLQITGNITTKQESIRKIVGALLLPIVYWGPPLTAFNWNIQITLDEINSYSYETLINYISICLFIFNWGCLRKL